MSINSSSDGNTASYNNTTKVSFTAHKLYHSIIAYLSIDVQILHSAHILVILTFLSALYVAVIPVDH